MTETLVRRILVEERNGNKIAVGVELADGRTLTAKREVILCAGAYRTPQVLMLSGIGPAAQLAKHGTKQIMDLPDVGRNLHDHLSVIQFWKLRNPDAGLAFGSPKFNDPAYTKGLPLDWIVTQTLPDEGLKRALSLDEANVGETHGQLSQRSHLELYIVYVGASANPPIPLDGTHIMTSVVGLLPTSRGSIELSSTDPNDDPIVDNNYYATEHDRHVMRSGLKMIGKMMIETNEGQDIVTQEVVAEGLVPLSSTLSDEELDAHVRFNGE